MKIIKCVTKDHEVYYTHSAWAAEHNEDVIACIEQEIDEDTICEILNDFEERFDKLERSKVND